MRPDDPRHGQRRGYYAHRRDGEEACDACKRAAAAAEARYAYNRDRGLSGRVSPVGTQRRLQALVAKGYTWSHLDRWMGNRMSEKFGSGRLQYVFPSTAAKVTALYDALADVEPPQTTPTERGAVTKAQNLARRKGWPGPDAWFGADIDDPDERPDPGYSPARDGDEVDPVVVERILSGDWRLKATSAERAEVVARWTGSLNDLARLTGWKVERYGRKESAA